MTKPNVQITEKERSILRSLAERKRELAESEGMAERRRLWTRHNALQPERPMLFVEPFGVRETMPYSDLSCESEFARGIESVLRGQLYQAEDLHDDYVVEPYYPVGWAISDSGYGVTTERHTADDYDGMGAANWTPPLTDLQKDLSLLKKRTFTVDREMTGAHLEALENLFGDILPPRLRGNPWWTMGMTITAIDLIGLQNLMLFMYDDPDGLHALMQFLMEDHMAMIDWLEEEELLNLNNRNDYIGSGSLGYSDELGVPEPDTVTAADLWVLSESQETVGVSPELFETFVFRYQLPIVERFGLSYYGCCEPLHGRWDVIKQLPNLRKVSISPWCDERKIAEAIGNNYVYCRKPNPTLVSTQTFDEDAIRADIRNTLHTCREYGCPVEIVLKDVHTVNNQPARLTRWADIAWEEIDALA